MSGHSKGIRLAARGAPQRHRAIFAARDHDPYRRRGKLPEPTVCPGCGLAFAAGRWQTPNWRWGFAPASANKACCPACRRIRERLPAGEVRIDGAFAQEHRDELILAIRRCEARTTPRHPLQRIVAFDDLRGGLRVTTTDGHLARRIGEALRRAYRGRLSLHYESEQPLLRVNWTR